MKSSARFSRGPREAEVVRHRRAVGVLADDEITLFGAQDQQRLDAEQPDAEIAPGLEEALEQRFRQRGARTETS